MENWIQKMNEMFEANEYTNEGRVTVDYCENANYILINVCGDTAVIKDLDRYNDFGLMMKCMSTIRSLYEPYFTE